MDILGEFVPSIMQRAAEFEFLYKENHWKAFPGVHRVAWWSRAILAFVDDKRRLEMKLTRASFNSRVHVIQ